jgi:hypothetical protein
LPSTASAVTCWLAALALHGWGANGKAYAFFDGLYLGALVSTIVYGISKLLLKGEMRAYFLISIAALVSASLYFIWHVLLML